MAATLTNEIPLGFTAPSFELPDAVTGNVLSSKSLFGGGPTIVVFMCNHCPFVIHILDEFVSMAREYQSRGVNVVAISSNDVVQYPQDDVPLMRALAERRGFTFPYLYDETQDVARAFNAACTPDFSVFDSEQKCVYRGQMDGSRPGNAIEVSGNDMRRVLDLILAGQSVPSEAQIPSLGCSIKWKN